MPDQYARHPLVQVVDLVVAHGFRFADRVLDRLLPRTLKLDPGGLEKLVPSQKRLQMLALVLRGAYMMNASKLDSEAAWEELSDEQKRPWVFLASVCWGTTFRLALEAQPVVRDTPKEGAAEGAQTNG